MEAFIFIIYKINLYRNNTYQTTTLIIILFIYANMLWLDKTLYLLKLLCCTQAFVPNFQIRLVNVNLKNIVFKVLFLMCEYNYEVIEKVFLYRTKQYRL